MSGLSKSPMMALFKHTVSCSPPWPPLYVQAQCSRKSVAINGYIPFAIGSMPHRTGMHGMVQKTCTGFH